MGHFLPLLPVVITGTLSSIIAVSFEFFYFKARCFYDVSMMIRRKTSSGLTFLCAASRHTLNSVDPGASESFLTFIPLPSLIIV